MQRKWQIILGAAVIILLGGVIFAQAMQGLNVDAHRLERADVALSFSEDGKVIAREQRPVHALISSRIEEVEVEEGNRVKEGDVLALLDDGEQEHQLEAPVDGKVIKLNAETGSMAGPEKPLFVIFTPGEYEVETRVAVQDIHEVEIGMEVMLTLERRGKDREFSGEVISIAPHAEEDISPLGLEEERVRVTVLPDIPEDVHLAPGYGVEVKFITAEEKNALSVPHTAIFSFKDRDHVFKVEDGRASPRQVTTGLETRRETVITEGLEEGELVIMDPQQEGLDEGTRVAPHIINEE